MHCKNGSDNLTKKTTFLNKFAATENELCHAFCKYSNKTV